MDRNFTPENVGYCRSSTACSEDSHVAAIRLSQENVHLLKDQSRRLCTIQARSLTHAHAVLPSAECIEEFSTMSLALPGSSFAQAFLRDYPQ